MTSVVLSSLLFILSIIPVAYSAGSCTNTTFDSPYYLYYFEEYYPTFTEGYGVPLASEKNVFYVGDRENEDVMELFVTYIRDPDSDTWMTSYSYPPYNTTLNTVLFIATINADLAVIVTEPDTFDPRKLHVYKFNSTTNQPSFVQELTHSACIPGTFGSPVAQNIATKKLAIGSNVIACTCNITSTDAGVVFWMRHYNGTWVEGTTVVPIDPSSTTSAQVHMKNTGYYTLISEPGSNQVHVYKRSPYDNLEMIHATTIYGPPASITFGSYIECRRDFQNQYDVIFKDLCMICDAGYGGDYGGCHVYNNVDSFPYLIANSFVQSPTPYDTIRFGTSIAFIDTISQPLRISISDGGDYSCAYVVFGACRTIRLYEFDSTNEQLVFLGDAEDPLTGPDVNFFGLETSGSYGTYEGYLFVSAVAISYYPYYDATNRVYVYSVTDQQCCGTSGFGADNGTVDACTLIDCLTDESIGIDSTDNNFCTIDTCLSIDNANRYTGSSHLPVDVSYYSQFCYSDITCTTNSYCGEYGWCVANLPEECPEYPEECRTYCEEDYLFQPMCMVSDYSFGLACSFGECNGFGECVSTMCDGITDTCRGISCNESRKRVYNSLYAMFHTLERCIQDVDVSVMLTIDYVTDTKLVREWVAESISLVHQYGHECNDSCEYWTGTVYPDLKRAYQIIVELNDALGCPSSHSYGINNLECSTYDNSELWNVALFEDLLDSSSKFPDKDVNDVVVLDRRCVFRTYETNLTVGMFIENILVAKGSWDSHAVDTTIDGSLSQRYPHIQYVHPDPYLDVNFTAITRTFTGTGAPTNEIVQSNKTLDGHGIIRTINNTASVLEDQTAVERVRHVRIVNTGLSSVRKPAFFTHAVITPDSVTTYPQKSLREIPVYTAVNVDGNRTAITVIPSGNDNPALNINDYSLVYDRYPSGYFVNGSCNFYWAYERVGINISHPDFSTFLNHLQNGGPCGDGCNDWYTNAPDLSKLFQYSLTVYP